jgi:hypothetical protein
LTTEHYSDSPFLLALFPSALNIEAYLKMHIVFTLLMVNVQEVQSKDGTDRYNQFIIKKHKMEYDVET